MNESQIRALAQQIHALTDNTQIKEWAQDIYDASPDPVVVPPVEPPTEPASITFYEHDNFLGASLTLMSNDSTFGKTPNFAPLAFNDRASSAKVTGRWECFADAQYRGKRLELEQGDYPSLRVYSMNDAISSCRPITDAPKSSGPRFFGYFGSDDAQVDETRDHTNLLFAAWGDDATLAARVNKAAMPAILDVSDCLFSTPMPRQFLADASANVRRRLKAMGGALPLVACLYVIDEPERESNVPASIIGVACDTCRAVAREFGISPVLHICYGDGQDYRGAEFVDWIGVNDYDGDALGKADRIELQPHQRLVLYPGGADQWRNDPAPFYEYAQGNPAVVAIIPFIWVSPWGGTRNKGIKDNGMADAYRAVGKAIKSQETT